VTRVPGPENELTLAVFLSAMPGFCWHPEFQSVPSVSGHEMPVSPGVPVTVSGFVVVGPSEAPVGGVLEDEDSDEVDVEVGVGVGVGDGEEGLLPADPWGAVDDEALT